MSETGTDNYICVINPIITAPQQDALPWRVEHTAGDTHPLRHNRSHHLGSNPRRRPPTSETQRRKLSAAQKAYVTTDPRWTEHRQKLADAQIARRMTLSPDELDMVLTMRSKGRTFSYIQGKSASAMT